MLSKYVHVQHTVLIIRIFEIQIPSIEERWPDDSFVGDDKSWTSWTPLLRRVHLSIGFAYQQNGTKLHTTISGVLPSGFAYEQNCITHPKLCYVWHSYQQNYMTHPKLCYVVLY